VSGSLLRYRIMAYIVGTGLVVLFFVGIPLEFGIPHVLGAPHNRWVNRIVGTAHGYLYLVYLAAAYDLWRRRHWSLWQLVATILAGFVPFLAFVVERSVTARVRRELAEESAGAGAGARPD
jgi:integral membrane protein